MCNVSGMGMEPQTSRVVSHDNWPENSTYYFDAILLKHARSNLYSTLTVNNRFIFSLFFLLFANTFGSFEFINLHKTNISDIDRTKLLTR